MTLAARLAGTRSVVFLTGAGISAESGLPTFRDAMTGLWARFRPEELATPEAFRSQPEVVWQWYRWRREQAAQARPNPGHKALAALQRRLPDALIVTQNVDGLHQRAGSHHVIELHGSLGRDRCSDAGCEVQTPGHDTLTPPGCPLCGAPLRPAVVWFGEALPADALRHAQERVNFGLSMIQLFLSLAVEIGFRIKVRLQNKRRSNGINSFSSTFPVNSTLPQARFGV